MDEFEQGAVLAGNDAERSTAPSGGRKQVLLRLDPAVHAALAKWAADDLRSVNAQIEILLRRSLVDAGRGVRAAAVPKRGRPARATNGEL